MPAAERDGELVADLAAERAGLSEAQVMGVGWPAAANDTGLRGDKPKMLLVAVASRLGDCEDALVDYCGIGSTGYVRGRSGRTGGWLDLFSGRGRLLVNRGWVPKLCQPLLELALDGSGIGRSQAVLGDKNLTRPTRRLVHVAQTRDLPQQSIPQGGGLVRGKDRNSGLSGGAEVAAGQWGISQLDVADLPVATCRTGRIGFGVAKVGGIKIILTGDAHQRE